MTEQDIQTYADRCGRELDAKQKKLKEKYKLSGQDDYELKLDEMRLHFKENGELVTTFSIIIIGSLAPVSRNWLWGWANESLNDKVREKSEPIKALFDETGIDVFRTGTFKADTRLAGELSALAIHKLGSDGLYQVPGGDDQGQPVRVYLALFPIETYEK